MDFITPNIISCRVYVKQQGDSSTVVCLRSADISKYSASAKTIVPPSEYMLNNIIVGELQPYPHKHSFPKEPSCTYGVVLIFTYYAIVDLTRPCL